MAEQVVGLRFVVEDNGAEAKIKRLSQAQVTLAQKIQVSIAAGNKQSAALDRVVRETNKVENELRRLAQANAQGTVSFGQFVGEMNKMAARLEALGLEDAKSKVFSFGSSALKAASEINELEQELRHAGIAVNGFSKNAASSGKYINQFGEHSRIAGTKTNKFGMVSQQVGYQVGDFFVQVQSGTDALVAFGQQGTQLAGLLPGLAGAIVGIALSLTTAFLNASLSAKNLTFDIKAFGADFVQALEPIAMLFQPIISAFSAVGEVVGRALLFLAQNIDSVIVGAVAASAVFMGPLISSIYGTAKAVSALTLAMAKNPLFLAAVVLASVAVAFYQVVKAVGELGKAIDAIGKVFAEVFSANNVGAVLDWFYNKFKQIWYGLTSVVIGVMADVAEYFADTFNTLGAIVMGTVEGVRSVMGALPSIIGDAAKRGVNLAIDAFAKMADAALIPINALIDGINALGGDLERISVKGSFNGLKLTVSNTGTSLGTAFSKGFARGYNDSLIDKPVLDSLRKAEAAAKSASQAAGTAAGAAAARLQGSATLDAIIASIVNQDGVFSGDYLVPDKGKGKGAEEDPLAKLLEEMQIRQRLIGLRGEELTLQKAIDEVQGKIGEKYKDPALIEALAKRLVLLQQQEEADKKILEGQQQLANTLETSMTDAFMSIVDGTASVKDAFKNMARLIITELYKVLIVQQMVGSFDVKTGAGSGIVGFLGGLFASADGNVFTKGSHVTAYANGGVVNGPTIFPMSNGTGLMGEAGPEAIMPLKRTKSGKLGVVAEAGGNVNQTLVFNIAANGDESVKRIVQQEAPRIAEQAKAAVLDAKRRGGSYGGKF